MGNHLGRRSGWRAWLKGQGLGFGACGFGLRALRVILGLRVLGL